MTAQRRREPEEGPATDSNSIAAIKFGAYRQREKGALKIGNCVLGKQAKRPHGEFRPALLRMREIEKIITARFGQCLPENDGDEFFRAIAHSLQVHGPGDVLTKLFNWCPRWAPWALSTKHMPTLKMVADSVRHRVHDLRADAVAGLLRVSMAERMALELRTIGACDVTRKERDKIMRSLKAERDRDTRAAERRRAGRQARDEYETSSLSTLKPWEAEGISRRTWYRRRGTCVSRVESTEICDTLVPTAATVEEKRPAAPVEGNSTHQERAANLDEKRLLYRRFLHPAHPDFIGSTTEVRQAA